MLTTVEQSEILSWMSVGFNIYGAYDIGSALNAVIFDPAKAPVKDKVTPVGKLPKYLDYRPQGESKLLVISAESRESYQDQLAARASVEVGYGAFSGHLEASFDSSVAQSANNSYSTISFQNMFGHVVQTDFDEAYLSDAFLKRLKALPDKTSPETLPAFSDFFKDFGAYFVSRITLGASLDYSVAINKSSRIETQKVTAKAEAEYDGLFVSGKVSAEMSSDKEWQTYRSERRTSLRVRGGADEERAMLNRINPKSLDSFVPATKQNFDEWQATTPLNQAVTGFSLTGIWEACGAKRQLVEQAFREYGKMMRPLLHVSTTQSNQKAPAVYLGGMEAQNKTAPGNLGWRVLAIDRKDPSPRGIRFDKLFSVEHNDFILGYRTMYNDMSRELARFRSNEYFLVFSAYGMVDGFIPPPDIQNLMREAGAGEMLDSWAKSVPTPGTTYIRNKINYTLVGSPGIGPGSGVEISNISPVSEPASKNSTLEMYFYSLGSGRPYVLGSVLRKLAATSK
jgi:MAC/Perforin domain